MLFLYNSFRSGQNEAEDTEISPTLPAPRNTQPLPPSTSPPEGTLIIIEPTLTYHHPPNSIAYSMVHSLCSTFLEFGQMYNYSIIEWFSCPKKTSVLQLIRPSLPITLDYF